MALGFDEPTAVDDLRDRGHGLWAGRRVTDLAHTEPASFTRWLGDPHFTAPSGESVADLVARASGWLEGIRPPEHVLAITHAALIRAFVVAGLACDPAAWFRLDIGHGTRTVLTRNGSNWRVVLVNAPL